MLWIERVRGGPLCGVPVQCSQVGQHHGALKKAEETQADLTHTTYTYRRAAVLRRSHTWADSTLNSLGLTNPPPSEPNP